MAHLFDQFSLQGHGGKRRWACRMLYVLNRADIAKQGMHVPADQRTERLSCDCVAKRIQLTARIRVQQDEAGKAGGGVVVMVAGAFAARVPPGGVRRIFVALYRIVPVMAVNTSSTPETDPPSK